MGEFLADMDPLSEKVGAPKEGAGGVARLAPMWGHPYQGVPTGTYRARVRYLIWGLGFRVWGLGFRVWGLGFRVLYLPNPEPHGSELILYLCLGAAETSAGFG